jgi:hypothetical protein
VKKTHIQLAMLCIHFLVVCLMGKFIADSWDRHSLGLGIISVLALGFVYFYFEKRLSINYAVSRLFCGALSFVFLFLSQMLFITAHHERYGTAMIMAMIGFIFWALRAWGFHDMLKKTNQTTMAG